MTLAASPAVAIGSTVVLEKPSVRTHSLSASLAQELSQMRTFSSIAVLRARGHCLDLGLPQILGLLPAIMVEAATRADGLYSKLSFAIELKCSARATTSSHENNRVVLFSVMYTSTRCSGDVGCRLV